MQKALDQAKVEAEGHKKKLEGLEKESKSAIDQAQERTNQAEDRLRVLVERMSGKCSTFLACFSAFIFPSTNI